ncbi:DUF6300 family protein [Streptomyces bobili]
METWCSRCGADLLLHWHGPRMTGVWMELCPACNARRPAARAEGRRGASCGRAFVGGVKIPTSCWAVPQPSSAWLPNLPQLPPPHGPGTGPAPVPVPGMGAGRGIAALHNLRSVLAPTARRSGTSPLAAKEQGGVRRVRDVGHRLEAGTSASSSLTAQDNEPTTTALTARAWMPGRGTRRRSRCYGGPSLFPEQERLALGRRGASSHALAGCLGEAVQAGVRGLCSLSVRPYC